jgi:hypothetical protein
MLFVASHSKRFREQFVSLAAAFVRLAEQADRNEQVLMRLDDTAEQQQQDQQQQQ